MSPDATTTPVRRVVLVVLDGLRPDAMSRFDLMHLERLAKRGASTFTARTVSPSVTACAMASLLTGVAPETHGMQSDRFHLPRPRGPVHPLARVLAEHSMPTSAFMAGVPVLLSGLAQRIARVLGFGDTRCTGNSAADVLQTATRTIEAQRRGLIVLHWPDADRAGHLHGWMSPEYAMAASRMDDRLGSLVRLLDLDDPSTLLIVLSDHGGGGRVLTHHDSDHPLDVTIPVVLAGGAVEPGSLGTGVSILDVPATVLWSLGIPRPASYVGKPMEWAFHRVQVAA